MSDSKDLICPLSSAFAYLILESAGPEQEAKQLPLRFPHEPENVFGGQCLGFFAAIGFHAPLQILAAPRSQAVTASRIPYKSKRCQHGYPFRLSIDGEIASLQPKATAYCCAMQRSGAA